VNWQKLEEEINATGGNLMIVEILKQKMIAALKGGDKKAYEALKLLVSTISYAKISKGEDLSDGEVIVCLKKEAKKRRESIEAYKKAGYAEKADQEEYEMKMIEEYLPAEMDEASVRTQVEEIAKLTGKTGGQLIGEVMKKLSGQVDGGVVAKIVASL
jgi:uncharacterized protein